MGRINVDYHGEFKATIVSDASKGTIKCCILVDSEDSCEFSSIDLFLCSIGNCFVLYTHRSLKKLGEDEINGLRVELDREMDFTDKPTIAKVTMDIFVPRPVNEATRQALLNSVQDTPVARTLNDKIQIIPTFHWAEGQENLS